MPKRFCFIAAVPLSGLTPVRPLLLPPPPGYVNFTLHGMPLRPLRPTCATPNQVVSVETDTTWFSFCAAARVASASRAIRFSSPLRTEETAIADNVGPCCSTGQPVPCGAFAYQSSYRSAHRGTGAVQSSSWNRGGGHEEGGREGWLGSWPAFHGDNNIYHHGGEKEGDRGVRRKYRGGESLKTRGCEIREGRSQGCLAEGSAPGRGAGSAWPGDSEGIRRGEFNPHWGFGATPLQTETVDHCPYLSRTSGGAVGAT